jgi:protein rhsA
LEGNNPNFYGYTFDCNTEVDVWGLDCDVAKTRKLAQTAKGANKLFECKTFANDLKTKMKKEGIIGEHIEQMLHLSNQKRMTQLEPIIIRV